MNATIRPAGRDDVPGILAILDDAILTTTASWHHEPRTLAEQLEWFDAKQAGDGRCWSPPSAAAPRPRTRRA